MPKGKGRPKVGSGPRTALCRGGARVLGPGGFPFPDGETEAQRGAVEVNRPEPCPSHTQTFLNRNIG